MFDVAILLHERGGLNGYFLSFLAQIWQANGVRVRPLQGPGQTVRADLAILHVDLTVVPDEYLALARSFPVSINANVGDISKRRISAHLVGRDDGHDGPVLVKTDLNSRGQSERRLEPAAYAHVEPPADYAIYESARRVPAAVWDNPGLVVERFLPERQGEFYCLRTWVFLGDRELHSLSFARSPVVKLANIVRREALGKVPAPLRRVRQEMGFGFGKFDYAVVDGEVVLYDVNRTPWLGHDRVQEFWPRLKHLAEGMRAYWPLYPRATGTKA